MLIRSIKLVHKKKFQGSQIRRLDPGQSRFISFSPAPGEIKASMVAAAEDLAKPTKTKGVGGIKGKIDADPESPHTHLAETNPPEIEFSIFKPGSSQPVKREKLKGQLFAENSKEAPSTISFQVPEGDAGGDWRVVFRNTGGRRLRVIGSVEFPLFHDLFETRIPLSFINGVLEPFVNSLRLQLELDKKRSFVGFSKEAASLFGVDQEIRIDLGTLDFVQNVRLESINARMEIEAGHPQIHMDVALDKGAGIDTGEAVDVSGIAAVAVKSLVEGHFDSLTGGLAAIGLVFPPLGGAALAAAAAVELIGPTVEFERIEAAIFLKISATPNNRRVAVQPAVELKRLELANDLLEKAAGGFIRKQAQSAIDETLKKLQAKLVELGGKSFSAYFDESFRHIVNRRHRIQEIVGEGDEIVFRHLDPRLRAGRSKKNLPPAPPPQPSPLVTDPDLDREALRRLDRIDHIIVLMMENRSFDHMLGYLTLPGQDGNGSPAEPTRTDLRGLTGRETNPDPNSDRAMSLKQLENTALPNSPVHEHEGVLEQINDGRMDGFVSTFVPKDGIEADDVMGFYTSKQVPVYDYIAEHFAVLDRWFASHIGSTWPNRFCMLSGHTPVLRNLDTSGKSGGLSVEDLGYLKLPTLFDKLDELAPDLWRYYESDVTFLRFYERFRLDTQKIRPIEEFFSDARGGNLAPVTFIDPDFEGLPSAGSNDDHPPADIVCGQHFIGKIIKTLLASPVFDRTMFIITYDEHGGFFDHYPPPGTTLGNRHLEEVEGEQPFDVPKVHPDSRSHFSVRVPAFVISPLVDARKVDSTIYDHTSISKTILLKHFGENFPDMGPRMQHANHLGSALSDSGPRRNIPSPPEVDLSDAERVVDVIPPSDEYHSAVHVLRNGFMH